jgi:hypothetical protein
MIASGDKVITTLRDRWRIEQEIQNLLHIQSQHEFSHHAQRVAESGEQVIPVILGYLGRADARTLSALGVVASFYPHREQILNKLYQAAADLDRPDRGRVSAMLILERFLGQEPDPYLVATLDDPQFMAAESIREMLREGDQDPRALIEYTRTLGELTDETTQQVIDTLLEIGQERAVPVLCLLAQDHVRILAQCALSALGRLGHPDAVRGLQSILPMLPADRRSLAQRALLKLQLKQIPVLSRPTADDTWRTLVGPIDGEGNQVIWFLHEPDEQGRCSFLGLTINDQAGINQAYGHHDVPPDILPEVRRQGHVHHVLLQGGRQSGGRALDAGASSDGPGAILHMLESDFEYGRRLVREGQSRNWQVDHLLPAEYRLLGPWLWQYDDAQVDASQRTVPASTDPSSLLSETNKLLYHPAFRGWFAYGERVIQHAAASLRRMPLATSAQSSDEVTRLAEDYFDEATVERLRTRLTQMSEWLWLGGERRMAELALAAAETLSTTPPEKHPLTRSMVELGLQVILEQLRHM